MIIKQRGPLGLNVASHCSVVDMVLLGADNENKIKIEYTMV